MGLKLSDGGHARPLQKTCQKHGITLLAGSRQWHDPSVRHPGFVNGVGQVDVAKLLQANSAAKGSSLDRCSRLNACKKKGPKTPRHCPQQPVSGQSDLAAATASRFSSPPTVPARGRSYRRVSPSNRCFRPPVVASVSPDPMRRKPLGRCWRLASARISWQILKPEHHVPRQPPAM